MSELGKRAVACRHWHWMPGMLSKDTGLRLDEMTDEWEGAVPDLTDPATLGCLLALVAEAYNLSLEDLCCAEHSYGWEVRQRRRARLTPDGGWTVDAAQIADDEYPTRAEALVAALEVAE